MTHDQPTSDPSPTAMEPIVDHESLRDRDDVPFHEDRDVVDPSVVDRVADLPEGADEIPGTHAFLE